MSTPSVPSPDDRPEQACAFCGAGSEERAFAATEAFLALYNISPILPGHTLVVPRRHVGGVLELSDAQLAAFFLFGRLVTRLLARAFPADGFDWTIQDGASAGQTVPHLHLHVIPRHIGDLPHPGDWYPALVASENTHIDSRTRPRLTAAEHAQVTAYLRSKAEEEEG